MRLIDADKFKKGLAVTDDTDASRNETFKKISEIICYLIDREPTVDTKHVKHSKWIPYGRDSAYTKFYRCSNCNYEIPIYEDSEDKPYKYCPDCGADMRGETDEKS